MIPLDIRLFSLALGAPLVSLLLARPVVPGLMQRLGLGLAVRRVPGGGARVMVLIVQARFQLRHEV